MFTIQTLDAENLAPYTLMVAPGLRRSLLKAIDNPGQIILGASFWGQAAGVVMVHTNNEHAQLTDIYVLPEYRRAGIGTALLAAAEEATAQAGAGKIHTVYRPDEHTPAFKALLSKGGWPAPTLSHIVFWTTREQDALHLPWVQKYRFRPPYQLVPLADVSEAEWSWIAERGETGWYTPDLSPISRAVDAWDPETSLFLRYNGEVVGWVLTVREAPLQLLIEILFVDPPLQRLGKGFMLIGEVTRRCWQIGMEDMYWRASPDNKPMVRWSRKAFQNALADEYEEWYTEKALTL